MPGPDRLSIKRLGYDHEDAQALTARLQAFYAERYGDGDDDPTGPSQFVEPEGIFLVGYVDGKPVATGAWRRVGVDRLGTTKTAELKRMHVIPEMQRRGFAGEILRALEESARENGFEALVLSTGLKQPEGIAFYEAHGYEPIQGFGHYAGAPLNRCYGKHL
ncbi:GNAT family N-acetyltransferase [Nocardioides sp. Kera G14]|uniref:GNAT family N-acetyltransferase n=1 Tax=Nocardioides sp. Kera G14 TaxID=2884264 RepID=UPI001D12627B|nr:GNAT family N-acetyltransferase [Nocardioides sp. Kera G14]UDY23986.1 GNAT family N-acetyltransferase [Nocardioides sp. Kera G14]